MAGRTSPSGLWRECGPVDTLILDFRSPELGENKFLLRPRLWSFVTAALGN